MQDRKAFHWTEYWGVRSLGGVPDRGRKSEKRKFCECTTVFLNNRSAKLAKFNYGQRTFSDLTIVRFTVGGCTIDPPGGCTTDVENVTSR